MKPAPQRFEIRDATLADVEAIASIHVEGWESTYRGIVSPELFGGRFHEIQFELDLSRFDD